MSPHICSQAVAAAHVLMAERPDALCGLEKRPRRR